MKDPKEVAERLARKGQAGIEGLADNMAFGAIGRTVLAMRAAGQELTWTTLGAELKARSEGESLNGSWYRAALKAIES